MHLFIFPVILTLAGDSALIATGSSSVTNGIKCWGCTSFIDQNCGNDAFRGMESKTLLKRNCANLLNHSYSNKSSGDLDLREPLFMRCIKTTWKVKGEPDLVIRGCSAPKDKVVEDEVRNGDCLTTESSEGGTLITCICETDYCNSTPKALTISLMAISAFFIIVLVFAT